MTSIRTSLEARELLERVDQAIEENIRLRALNRVIREKVRTAFSN
ncbi:hypothetical protein [Bradyrhizobium sp. 173]|nr:hypothetical protein [Bradyrhizobium sp. 173]